MSRPAPHPFLRLLCAAALALMGSLGCINNTSGGTTLYAYDQGSSSVLVWNDINAVYKAAGGGGTVAAADRTITSSLMPGRLAWGGVAIDSNKDLLYMVSETGTVTVVTQASTQNGAITSTTYCYQFTLGQTQEQFSNAAFGQAAVDATSDILYVLETTLDGRQSRVWRVPTASQQHGTVTPATSFTMGNNTPGVYTDTYGVGVAPFPGGSAFGLFGGGNSFSDTYGASYSGARLRLSQGAIWVDPVPPVIPIVNVIVGGATNNTGLSSSLTYGSLGYDAQNTLLFVTSQGSTPAGVMVFNRNQFTGTYNQAPARVLGDSASAVANLRILSHPPTSDWLLGASFSTAPSSTSTGDGNGTLMIWQGPSSGTPSAVSAALPGVTNLRGMAIGGS